MILNIYLATVNQDTVVKRKAQIHRVSFYFRIKRPRKLVQ